MAMPTAADTSGNISGITLRPPLIRRISLRRSTCECNGSPSLLTASHEASLTGTTIQLEWLGPGSEATSLTPDLEPTLTSGSRAAQPQRFRRDPHVCISSASQVNCRFQD